MGGNPLGKLSCANPWCTFRRLLNFQALMDTRHDGFGNTQADVAPRALPAVHGFQAQHTGLVTENATNSVLVFVPQLCNLLWGEMMFERPPGHTATGIGWMLILARVWGEFGHGMVAKWGFRVNVAQRFVSPKTLHGRAWMEYLWRWLTPDLGEQDLAAGLQ